MSVSSFAVFSLSDRNHSVVGNKILLSNDIRNAKEKITTSMKEEMDDVKLRLTNIEKGQAAGIAGTQMYLKLWIDAAKNCANKQSGGRSCHTP